MATDPESYCDQIREMASYIDELCYLSGDTNNDFRNGFDQHENHDQCDTMQILKCDTFTPDEWNKTFPDWNFISTERSHRIF